MFKPPSERFPFSSRADEDESVGGGTDLPDGMRRGETPANKGLLDRCRSGDTRKEDLKVLTPA
jgi:hypothetical protein